MALITFDDKDDVSPLGSTVRTWRAEDANEVKEVVNENALTSVLSVVAGSNVTVDNTDPQNPILSSTGGGSAVGGTSQLLTDGATLTWDMASNRHAFAHLRSFQTVIDFTLSNFPQGTKASLILEKFNAPDLRLNFLNSGVTTFYDKNGNDITGGAGGLILSGPINSFFLIDFYNYDGSTYDAIWVDVQGNKADNLLLLTDWDMSTNLFPSSSVRGQKYYGINGPTSSRVDRLGSIIPNGVFLTSLLNNASTTDPTQWAIEYTII